MLSYIIITMYFIIDKAQNISSSFVHKEGNFKHVLCTAKIFQMAIEDTVKESYINDPLK